MGSPTPNAEAVGWVDAHRDEAVALLEKVVNIPSATSNLAGVREVGKVFEAEFARIGFATRWDEMPREMNRAGHLIAEHAGHARQAGPADRPPRHRARRPARSAATPSTPAGPSATARST